MTQRRAIFLVCSLIVGVAAVFFWERYGPRPKQPDIAEEIEQIDHILIEKGTRRLTAFRNGDAVLAFDIALGFGPVGTKQQEGDGKTPEGLFKIDRKNPNSAFHLSLGIDYPQTQDVARAKAAGIDPGRDIFIHGQPNGIGGLATLPGDWTAGCMAVSNAEIEQLWHLTPIGATVEIRP